MYQNYDFCSRVRGYECVAKCPKGINFACANIKVLERTHKLNT